MAQNQRLKLIIFIWIPLFAEVSILNGQLDNSWILGYSSQATNDTLVGKTLITFPNKQLKISKTYNIFRPFSRTCASISDSIGNLLFYTNGFSIYNKNDKIMPNGANICPGELAEANKLSGLAITQGALILPLPESKSKYILLHKLLQADAYYYCDSLYETIIDMQLNGGLGDVIQRHKVIVSDSISIHFMTACKHANGRDWWIPIFRKDTNLVLIYLLSTYGLTLHSIQILDHKVNDIFGQASFSPNGNLLTILGITNLGYREFLLYKFDRCEGLFSNQEKYIIPATNDIGTGVSFSPSSELIYLALGDRVWQLDVKDGNDIIKNKIVVQITDTFGWPYPFNYDRFQHAPDGKLYFISFNGANYLNVIHEPDKKGLACRPEPHAYNMTFNISIPNNPYFNLGREIGTVCDSLITQINDPISKEKQEEAYVYTINTYGSLYIHIPITYYNKNLSYIITDMQGRIIKQSSSYYNQDIHVSDLNSGVYLVRLIEDGRVIMKDKCVVVGR